MVLFRSVRLGRSNSSRIVKGNYYYDSPAGPQPINNNYNTKKANNAGIIITETTHATAWLAGLRWISDTLGLDDAICRTAKRVTRLAGASCRSVGSQQLDG